MRTAFTLVELLVVITIVVVLLALLAPAMDKAIYQAELAVCGANQDALAGGATLYAMGSRRFYPHRPGVQSNGTWATSLIYNGNDSLNGLYNFNQFNTGSLDKYDDRTLLRTFLPLNAMLNDPLTPALDYEEIDADSHAYSAYNLWFGYRYNGHPGMVKVGGKLTWAQPGMQWEGALLASDRDSTYVWARHSQTSHPDYDGVATSVVLQNGLLQNGHTSDLPFKLTISTWLVDGNRSPQPRGAVDLNFAYEDGSVRRFNNVVFDRSKTVMAYIPESTTNVAGAYQQPVPQ